jgi:hypothetical protein
MSTCCLAKGPFIYYVITFLGFLAPPPPLRKHVFSTENNQKLAFSDRVMSREAAAVWCGRRCGGGLSSRHFLTPLPPLQVIK